MELKFEIVVAVRITSWFLVQNTLQIGPPCAHAGCGRRFLSLQLTAKHSGLLGRTASCRHFHLLKMNLGIQVLSVEEPAVRTF